MKQLKCWKWKAADLEGKVFKGTWEHADYVEVRQGLKGRGLFPLDIRPLSQIHYEFLFANNVKIKWIRLAKNLSLLLDAGIPLFQALDILSNRDSGRMNHSPEQLKLVKSKVQEGAELSEAITVLRPLPDSFIRFMIRAGEQSGTLVQTLDEIASSLESDVYFGRKIKAALTYPLILLSLTVIIVMALGLWLLPMYQNIFTNFDGELPLLTKVIFGLGQYLPGGLLLLLLASGGLIIVTASVPSVRISLLKSSRNLPLWGSILLLTDEEQFSRILGRLLRAGIPILDALNLLKDAESYSRNHVLVEELVFAVNEGRRLTPVFRMNKVFSPDKCEMFRIGEESGKLEEALSLISKWARMELDEKFDEFSRLIEPLLIIVIAGLIGLIAIGVLQPVLQASTYIN